MDKLRVGVNELREVVNEHLDSNQQSKNSQFMPDGTRDGMRRFRHPLVRAPKLRTTPFLQDPIEEIPELLPIAIGTTAHAVGMTTSGGDEASESAELLHLHPNVIH